VAEHLERKVQHSPEEAAAAETQPAETAAAQAAARVAARYANAPSYSQMVADEARAALRAAEAASQAALDARDAAKAVLANIEADLQAEQKAREVAAAEFNQRDQQPAGLGIAEAPVAESDRILDAPSQPAARHYEVPTHEPPAARTSFEIRWDADLPIREANPAPARTSRGTNIAEASAPSNWKNGVGLRDGDGSGYGEGFEVVEAAQPIHANLIHFPRELVAARKVRPRLVEGPYGTPAEDQRQLSIFEVEPESISTAPLAAARVVEPSLIVETNNVQAVAVPTDAVQRDLVEAVAGPVVEPQVKREIEPQIKSQIKTAEKAEAAWSQIAVEEQRPAVVSEPEPARSAASQPLAAQTARVFERAPMQQRAMAFVVDFALITAALIAAALVAAANTAVLPSMETMAIGAFLAWAGIGAFYLLLFFGMSKVTPGMRYAGLKLAAFDGKAPTRRQRITRALATVAAMLPLGLGVCWGVLTDEQIGWHDRVSGTYQRKA
jgi:uncharacterized RDD family membrane protein YckC